MIFRDGCDKYQVSGYSRQSASWHTREAATCECCALRNSRTILICSHRKQSSASVEILTLASTIAIDRESPNLHNFANRADAQVAVWVKEH